MNGLGIRLDWIGGTEYIRVMDDRNIEFAAKFMEALRADFDAPSSRRGMTQGQMAIAVLREEKPDQYVKVCAGLLPKETSVHAGGALSDFLERVNQAQEQRALEYHNAIKSFPVDLKPMVVAKRDKRGRILAGKVHAPREEVVVEASE